MDHPCCVCISFFEKKLQKLSTPVEFIRKFGEVCVLPIILYSSPAIYLGRLKRSIKLIGHPCGWVSAISQISFKVVLWLCGTDSLRQSAPSAWGFIEGKVIHLHQEPFQAATPKDCCLSELCPSNTVTTSGWPKRGVELLLTEAVLMSLSPFPNCTTAIVSITLSL